MQELRELLRVGSTSVPLDVAALQIGCIENPEFGIAEWLELLDSHASEFGERVTPDTPGEDFITLLNEYLFEELEFQGNADDYYDPANSCLQHVRMRRLGIPITLSIVYMEIARRLKRTVHGVGLPGHFLVMYEDAEFEALIDPFHGGTVLSPTECFDLAREATGMPLEDDESMLTPVPARHIAIRMLNNLRATYFRRREPAKAVQVLDLLIEATPDSAEEYKQRGICLAQTERLPEAERDLQRYLLLAPSAEDATAVAAELDRIRQIIELQS